QPLAPQRGPQKFRSLQQASQEVAAIIDQLNDVLCDMELVAKMLDDVEIQQHSDEKEIESLRNALRQFQNPPRPVQQPHRDLVRVSRSISPGPCFRSRSLRWPAGSALPSRLPLPNRCEFC